MLQNTENIALRSSQIFCTFVFIPVEIVTIFELKVVAISARNTINKYRKFANFLKLYIFRTLQHFFQPNF